jgi:LysM repeat protein
MAKAENVINWWQRQADGVSAHDVICLDGTLYHAVPYDQMAYQVGCKRGYTKDAVSRLSAYPNDCVIGIECAHLDWDGTMTPATYNTLVQHTAKLVKQEGLGLDDIWLHSQIVGKDYKDCHRWFTTTKPSDWDKFLKDVDHVLHPPAPKPATNYKTYVIKSGDTLSALAIKFNTTVDILKKLNSIPDRDVIHIGEKIKYKA